MTEDNWKHRSADIQCYSCMHYNNFRCRKHAPTLNGWPAIFPDDWCGDHKLNKVEMQRLYFNRTETNEKIRNEEGVNSHGHSR